jgi:hypothetical protein
LKRVLVGGLLGAAVLMAWFVVADGFLGFKRSIDMKRLGDERMVYAFLAEHVTEPGRYVCNPELLPEQRFPGQAPIFAVQYSGLGHDDAGQEILVGLVVALLASMGGAWVLAHASTRILSRYSARVLFLAMVGIVLGLLTVAGRFGISGYPLSAAVALGAHDLAGWVLAGLAMGLVVRPSGERASGKAG